MSDIRSGPLTLLGVEARKVSLGLFTDGAHTGYPASLSPELFTFPLKQAVKGNPLHVGNTIHAFSF
jgi:hypothetical protein